VDDQVRKLERRWRETGTTPDGVAYYHAVAQAGDLPCPSCGWRESLNDLERRRPRPIHLGSYGREGAVAIGVGTVWNRRAPGQALATLLLEGVAPGGLGDWIDLGPTGPVTITLPDPAAPPPDEAF
jgi:hypothetical protein